MLDFKNVPGYSTENWKAEDIHLPDTPWIRELEEYRWSYHETHPLTGRGVRPLDVRAEAKRKAHKGGDINHRFEGERYLNCPDKHFRRMQLRKLVDEGGEVSVGGLRVSHPKLSRWESYAYGVQPEEVDALEKADADAEMLVARGWWVNANRTEHWAVAFGSSMMGEGGTAQRSKELIAGIEEDAKRLAEWGVVDVERALLNRWEHAGIDVDHAQMAYDVADEFITTPEMQQKMAEVFKLRLQMRTGG